MSDSAVPLLQNLVRIAQFRKWFAQSIESAGEEHIFLKIVCGSFVVILLQYTCIPGLCASCA